MERPSLVVVAPRLPPQACGVGTYAWELSRHWPDPRPTQRFLVGADALASQRALQDAAITEFQPDARHFLDALETQGDADVLLHYAGRGYHRFGFPFWMAKAFARWKQKGKAARLHIIFHELPADLPLLSRQGVLQRLSFVVARKLTTLADTLITNSEHHAALLGQWAGATPVHWFPVPSNIPRHNTGAASKERGAFAIFGLPYTRLQTVRVFAQWLQAWRGSGRLRKLHLIGPPDEKFSPQTDEILARIFEETHVVRHGELSAVEVSQQLAATEFCLSAQNNLTWSKSGTFMAYAAHGCAVVTDQRYEAAPLEFAVPAASLEQATDAEIHERASKLREWYVGNATWEITAQRIADVIAASKP